MVTASRSNGRPSIQLAQPIWRKYVHVSVRECIRTREVGCPCAVPRIHAFAQASTVSKILSNQDALVVLGILAILVIVLVVLPAVWSEKPTRRKAALAVLDRLLRWRG
jgi:hypothetical protein